MENKLLLICAPSGTGKSTVARVLSATDQRFKHVLVHTTRSVRDIEMGKAEKVQTSFEKMQEMNEDGLLVNFNEKDGTWYGIEEKAISGILEQNINPVLEWDLNRINFFDKIYPVFKVILRRSDVKKSLSSLKDGRDPDGIREKGVKEEYKKIMSGEYKADHVIINLDLALNDTIVKIRKAFFQE